MFKFNVPQPYLQSLKSYRYDAKDCSILGLLFLQYFWNFLVRLLPRWLAPNAITIAGFIAATVPACCVAAYIPDVPSWCWALFAAGVFIYSTFDAIDGKHARRHKTESAFGELLDHGCDSCVAPLVQICIPFMIAYTSWEAAYLTVLGGIVLFTAIWEHYATGLFELGYINGPVEGAMLVVLCAGISSVWTPSFFSSPLSVQISVYGHVLVGNWHDAIVFVTLLGIYLDIALSLLHTIMRPRIRPAWEVLLPLFVVAFVAALLWVCWPTVIALQATAPSIVPAAFCFMCSHMSVRLSIARLCTMPHKLVSFGPSYLNLACALLLVWSHFCMSLVASQWIAYLWLLVSSVTHVHFVLAMLRQFAQCLGLNYATLTRQQLEALQR